ncbi:MAG: FAD-dependent oxidoreductase, partial [Chlorobia bacterium]|nr:FAD-dependent oxidoreductase [Fimbriimonadaceae bacterium]
RAKGGVGLFVIGCTSPKPGSGWLENLDDSVIPRYQACVDAGHRHGTPIIAQLCHPGFYPLPGVPLTQPLPSVEPTQPRYRPHENRRELSKDELQDMIACFGDAAGRAAEGGVDGVELHSHEWFLHSQMLNSQWNTRTDEYGGPIQNRIRFMIETLQAMRKAVGPDLVVGVRLKADDMEQAGSDPTDYRYVIRRLEEEKLVDYVLLTGGDARLHHGPMARPDGEWIPIVSDLKKGTTLPIMHAGSITTPEMAEEALASGAMDVVVMTKSHIAEPHFVKKVFEGRLDDIRYCTRCLQSCHGTMDRMTCVYNPLTSRELAWSSLPTLIRKKKIVIVGAGPAGMEAAIAAASRGHEVVVLEKSDRIGGQVLVGAQSPTRKLWGRIAEFYQRQAAKGLFEVSTGVNATLQSILGESPDAVIVATGSKPLRLLSAGINHEILTVHEALAGQIDREKSVVILDREGFMRPIVVADRLSALGAKVHFVTPFPRLSPSAEGWTMDELVRQFKSRGMEFHVGCDLAEWHCDGSVVLRDVMRADKILVPNVGAVVAAIGSSPVNDLAIELRGKVPELHVIGDANNPATVEFAAYQGMRIGREI